MTNWKQGATIAPVPIGKLHGDWTKGGYRLAPIVNGKVFAAHVETAEVVECNFSIRTACCWAESERGEFAAVGQAISRDGEPGGDYIVAARVCDKGTVPALDLREAGDAVGPAAGCELSGGAVVEQVLSVLNANLQPLQHFCPATVCTSSHPHPDDAELVGSADGPVFCYTGRGAAFNDINGHEVDVSGFYLPGRRFVHVLFTGGFEVPAAKRPATRSFPSPARIIVNTTIVWRPVNPNLNIGSAIFGSGCP